MSNCEKCGPRLIIQIGPELAAQGGIAAVLNSYASYHAGFERLGYRHLFISSAGGAGIGRILKFFVAWFHLAGVCLFCRVHLVHIHSSIKGSLLRKLIFAMTCRILRKRHIIHIHSGAFVDYYNALPKLFRLIVRSIFSGAACIICLSADVRNRLISSRLVTIKKCKLVYNGIVDPLTEFSRQRHESTHVAITFLGKLSESKGLLTLLQAVATLPNSDRRYTLFVGGAGDLSTFEEWVRGHGISDRVVFKGWVTGESKVRLLTDTHIFVLPSRSEGFPVAIVEAMAFGAAIVSTLIPGVVDAIRQGRDGLLINPDDRDSLRDALWQLMNDGALRERLGASARQRFLDQFTMHATADRLVSIYNSVS
jgi:glycosyltransferase involved in cell wall biosynthesis